MAVTDYNREKPLTVESVAGTPTVDKATPIQVIGESVPKETDGFEDGNYTSSPQWTVEGNDTSANVASGGKNGSYELRVSASTNELGFLQHDRGGSDSVNDGDVYQVWIQTESQNDGRFTITNSGGAEPAGNDAIQLAVDPARSDTGFTIKTTDGTGTNIENRGFGPVTSDLTWYLFEITLYPSTSDVGVKVFDTNKELITTTTANTSGASNLQYVKCICDQESTYAAFDDVSYSTTDSSTALFSESDTGNGDIIVDFANVSSESDIAVYDQNDNLLSYEIETFDPVSKYGVFWIYDSWVRDGSTQAKVVYGNGPASSEEGGASDVWGNTGQNAVMVQHLQENPNNGEFFLDSTFNNNDGTWNGGNDSGVSGQFDGAQSFDGTDDYIDLPDITSLETTEFTVVADVNFPADGTFRSAVTYSNTFGGGGSRTFTLGQTGSNTVYWVTDNNSSANTEYSPGGSGEYLLAGTLQSSTQKLFVDGTEQASNESGVGGSTSAPGVLIGSEYNSSNNVDNNAAWNGYIDEVKLYTEAKSNDWVQAEYDASPKAGQVFFSQQAASTTATTTTDSASKTSMSMTPQTTTEVISQIDTATKTSMVMTPETAVAQVTVTDTATRTSMTMTPEATVETSSATDTAVKTSQVMTVQTSVETADYLDTATKTSMTMTPETSVEVEVDVDTATKTSMVMSPETTTEFIPVTDNASKTGMVMTPQTSVEEIGEVDTATRTSMVMTPETTTEISDATDTATRTSMTMTPEVSAELATFADQATKTSMVMSPETSAEIEVRIEEATKTSMVMTPETTTETELIKGLGIQLTTEAKKRYKLSTEAK